LGTLGELFSWFAASSASSGFSKDFLLLEPFDELEDVESGLGAFVADEGTRFKDSSIDFIILPNAQWLMIFAPQTNSSNMFATTKALQRLNSFVRTIPLYVRYEPLLELKFAVLYWGTETGMQPCGRKSQHPRGGNCSNSLNR
jgi:hypothetical protein